MRRDPRQSRRATILLMVVGLLSMLFVIVTAYITLSRVDRLTLLQARRAGVTDQVVNSVHTLVLNAIRAQGEDAAGNIPTGAGGANADIPGPGGAVFLSSPEPVPDPTAANRNHPGAYRYPAVGSLDSSRPLTGPQSLDDLMEIDYATRNGTDAADYANKLRNLARDSSSDVSAIDGADTADIADARLLDAGGTGMPETRQAAMALAILIANAIAGVPVVVPTVDDPNALLQIYDPANLPPVLARRSFARQYDKLARFDVAARVVSTGGKVSLYSPDDGGAAQPWNREWVAAMFNHLSHPQDNTALNPAVQAHSDLLDELSRNAEAVEPLFGRRGGLLASWLPAGASANSRAVLEVERRLEGLFPNTLSPTFQGAFGDLKREDHQRFNLGLIHTTNTTQLPGFPALPPGTLNPGEDDWEAYRLGVTLDAQRYNYESHGGAAQPTINRYLRRQALTMLNFSDDVARKQGIAPTVTDRIGVEEGQLKFYLGEITRDNNDDGAFDVASGAFDPSTGARLIRRIANYTYDMLDGYDGWDVEAVSQREQAMMLAVNIVASAAPRDGTGRIDVVSYTDSDPDLGVRTYVGYGPQPFLTQVIASDDGGGRSDDLGVGVEIYNPNDDDGVGLNVPGKYALDLTQFAVSVNNTYDGTLATLANLHVMGGPTFTLTPGRERLAGRSFAKFTIRRSGNTQFTNDLYLNHLGEVVDPTLSSVRPGTLNQSITVKLWKLSAAGATYLVDQMELEYPDNEDFESDATDPDTEEKWFAEVKRDTRTELFWGLDANGQPARWRVVMDVPPTIPSATHYSLFASSGADVDPNLAALGQEDSTGAVAPPVPLVLMNAPLSTHTFMGVPRPSSFPTTGFLAFVPRFSHIRKGDGTTVPFTFQPMGRVLYDQFAARLYAFDDSVNVDTRPDNVPADFGHMPLFDNNQDAEDDGPFADSAAGRIPWGLLVFDYFTTVNPRGIDDNAANTADNIDPRRIPGRLNVNAAPWFLLAGLPIVDPIVDGSNPNEYIDHGASPSFWDPTAGMLVGVGNDLPLPKSRFVGTDDAGVRRTAASELPYFDATIRAYRLGPYLAQSAAAYRDRVQYVSDNMANNEGSAYWAANRRNIDDPAAVPPVTRYRDNPFVNPAPKYGRMRGDDLLLTPRQGGLLSIGELLNVAGFDSTRADPPGSSTLPITGTVVDEGDFLKGVSLLALLDTHFLTSRSNTFTVYVTVMDRQNPQASVRSQLTVDRSNLVPRLMLESEVNVPNPDSNLDGDLDDPYLIDTDGVGGPDTPAVIRDHGQPRILAERRVGYFNARYDE